MRRDEKKRGKKKDRMKDAMKGVKNCDAKKKSGRLNVKAQITLFVIIGILVLVIFVFLLSLRKKLAPDAVSPEKSLDRVLKELTGGVVESQMIDCLNKITSDGIEKIAANGGLIYDFQNGTYPFSEEGTGSVFLPFSSSKGSFYVAYGLEENRACDQIDYSIPGYPVPERGFADISALYFSQESFGCGYADPSGPSEKAAIYDGFFGRVVFPKLCYKLEGDPGCKEFASGEVYGLTIQRQLEDYLMAALPSCANFSEFSNRLDADISVDAPPQVKVNIRDEEVLVRADYPVRISFDDQDSVVRVMTYKTVIKARFGLLYNFIYDLLTKDSKKIEFDLMKEHPISSYFKKEFKVFRHKDACDSCEVPFIYDDVLEFYDTASLINGKSLLFRTSIHNRRPALDFIANFSFDIVSGNELKLPIIAFDPDDSELKYLLLSGGGVGDGWRETGEDYAEILDGLNEHQLLDLSGTRQELFGNHTVALLVYDDSGLFDYQWFTINVSDSSLGELPRISEIPCIVHMCSDPGSGYYCSCATNWGQNDWQYDACSPAEDIFNQPPALPPEQFCTGWSWLAYYICIDSCSAFWPTGGSYTYPSDECQSCVQSYMLSNEPEEIKYCGGTGVDKAYCLSLIPDCFWLSANNSDVFEEGCYEDFELSNTGVPAYLIDSLD